MNLKNLKPSQAVNLKPKFFTFALCLKCVLAFSGIGHSQTMAIKDSLASLIEQWVPTSDSINVELNDLDSLKQLRPIRYVDIRSKKEQLVSMIPNALTIKEFEKKVQEQSFGDTLYIAYCTIGYRSGLFTEKYRAQGVEVLNLKGGVLAWAHAQRLFWDKGHEEIRKVHVYDKPWDYVPKNYQSTY